MYIHVRVKSKGLSGTPYRMCLVQMLYLQARYYVFCAVPSLANPRLLLWLPSLSISMLVHVGLGPLEWGVKARKVQHGNHRDRNQQDDIAPNITCQERDPFKQLVVLVGSPFSTGHQKGRHEVTKNLLRAFHSCFVPREGHVDGQFGVDRLDGTRKEPQQQQTDHHDGWFLAELVLRQAEGQQQNDGDSQTGCGDGFVVFSPVDVSS
mmetsp:Transcript_11046/g.16454  ORF Transcript_11046/g.16454 Transcript_11046/m.16454 type:complete len:207 (-) Transcript_11046:1189-1809(-)